MFIYDMFDYFIDCAAYKFLLTVMNLNHSLILLPLILRADVGAW